MKFKFKAQKEKIVIAIEIILILIYLNLTLQSLFIQPVYLILGVICILFIPGYNLVKLFFPSSSITKRIGYMTITSLAIENIIMILIYIFSYNFLTAPETSNRGLIFNSKILIIIFLSISIVLTILNLIRNLTFKDKNNYKRIYDEQPKILKRFRKKTNFKVIILFLIFILSLILLAIASFNSNMPEDNSYMQNLSDYTWYYTFFSRVPALFYLFLFLAILSLSLIILNSQNKYIVLISISLFLYCLWILPFLQIKNYFTQDAMLLYNVYEGYANYGLEVLTPYLLGIFNTDALRYSTGLFNTIILMTSCQTDINFTLWFLYPLFYLLLPFLFYSVFESFIKKTKSTNSKNEKMKLFVLTLLSLLSPQFLKSGHTPGTGFLGIILFFILVIEFFIYIKNESFKTTNFIYIIFIYFFLCLTHTEECIYFLILLILFSIYYPFFKILNGSSYYDALFFKREYYKQNFDHMIFSLDKSIDLKKTKNVLLKSGFLLIALILVFYFTLEIFGWIRNYLNKFLETVPSLSFIEENYLRYKTKIPFLLRGGFRINLWIIWIFVAFILLIYILTYFIYYKLGAKIYKIFKKLKPYLTKIYLSWKRIIAKRAFKIFLLILSYISIIIVDIVYLRDLETDFLLQTLSITLGYSLSILSLYLLIEGTIDYKPKSLKQNYYYLAIIATSSIMFAFILIEKMWYTFYIFHTKFLTYIVFLNLVVIQHGYFNKVVNIKKKYLLLFLIIILFLGIFVSLRALRFG